MTLDIAEAIEGAVDKTISSTGAQVMALFFVVSLLNTVAGSTLLKAISDKIIGGFGGGALSAGAGMSGGFPLALEMPLWLAGFSALGGLVLSTVGSIGAIRALEGSVSGLKRSHFTRNVAWTGINLVVGGIVFGIVAFIGSFMLIVPGLFLLSALYLWNFYTITEDQSFIEGFKSSWEATSNDADGDRGRIATYIIYSNRFRVLYLLLNTGILTFFVMAPINALLALTVGQGVLAQVLKTVPGAITTTFTVATFVAVYDQLG